MFAPHELLGALYQSGWDMFSEVLLGGIPEGFTESWNAYGPEPLLVICLHTGLALLGGVHSTFY